MRITKAFVRARFERVAEIFRWNTEAYREGKAQVGAVILDHAACYGGYRLDYIANEHGAQGFMFGRINRHSGPEMVAYLTGLEDGAAVAWRGFKAAGTDALTELARYAGVEVANPPEWFRHRHAALYALTGRRSDV